MHHREIHEKTDSRNLRHCCKPVIGLGEARQFLPLYMGSDYLEQQGRQSRAQTLDPKCLANLGILKPLSTRAQKPQAINRCLIPLSTFVESTRLWEEVSGHLMTRPSGSVARRKECLASLGQGRNRCSFITTRLTCSWALPLYIYEEPTCELVVIPISYLRLFFIL